MPAVQLRSSAIPTSVALSAGLGLLACPAGKITAWVVKLQTSPVVVPIGLNIYPFSSKAFGFQMELAPIIGDDVLRGSWGIRYRFIKED